MPRPIAATVCPDAIQHNLNYAVQCSPQSKLWAVIKANACGYGIKRIYPALKMPTASPSSISAVRVRELGWDKPILLLEGLFETRHIEIVDQSLLTVAVQCDVQLDLLSSANTAGSIDIQLKMNSGMNRLGFRPDVFRAAWERATAHLTIDWSRRLDESFLQR